MSHIILNTPSYRHNRAYMPQVSGPVTRTLEDKVLGQLDYDTIAQEISDDNSTVVRANIITGAQVARRRFTPQQVVDKLHGKSVLVLRRSWWGELPRFLLLALAILFSLYLIASNGLAHIYSIVPIMFIPLTVISAIVHRRLNRKYTVNSDSVTIITGLISWRMTRISIPVARFKAIEVKKTIVQRILGVGDIQISTVMFDQPEVEMAGLNNPHFYMAVLKLLHEDEVKKEEGDKKSSSDQQKQGRE